MAPSFLECSAEVRAAVQSKRPVVALESTLIAHGLPWPANLETAREAESRVRAAGAIPATIAVVDGTARVGLEPDDIERLARASGILKASTRDLPALRAAGVTGATTVAATAVLAHRAGIVVLATGGIGGVHRGARTSFDISADLDEIARTPVAVVCSGAKSILDLPATLEQLESRGVAVIGYRTDELPSFFSASSGLRLDTRADTPQQVAAIWRAARELGLERGMVVAQPPPPDRALPAAEVEAMLTAALADADRAGIRGKALTPFLLARLHERSGGRTLAVNRALVVENARLAGEIACALR